MGKAKGITSPKNEPYDDDAKFAMEQDYSPSGSVEYGERDADNSNVDMEDRAKEVLQKTKRGWDATVHGYHKVK